MAKNKSHATETPKCACGHDAVYHKDDPLREGTAHFSHGGKCNACGCLQYGAEDPEEVARRKELEAQHGQVWDTSELQQDFEVKSFLAPFVMVTRKSDRKPGTLQFDHRPRFYFHFVGEGS